ncbi:hypothetical protein AWW68_02010 [Roseivirga spongicola]|uniref:histidine kinase n=1 Tax=Roseivirga spongicola TaxID=333140 RepID=A0A150XFS5_9BACT|nr:sensor histidine kinase [Roseivirga spongicola]KYG77570.1 hypothetical protein AWW68_02010 [Roseivirga spongicola]
MKTHRAIGFFLFCLLRFAYVSVANGQDRLAEKMDSLQSIVDQTKAQDSLKLLYAEQLSIAQQQGDLKKEALLELKLGASSDYTGVEMERHYAKALAIYTQTNDTLGMTRANYEIANAKQLQNDYDSTRIYAERSVALAEQQADTVGIIKGRLLLSSMYSHLALYTQSLQELNKGRMLAERMEDNQAMVQDILNKESFALYSLEEYDKSAEKISQIIEMLKPSGNARRLNVWSNNLASVYSLCQGCVSFERRKSILREAIAYAEEANFAYGKAYSYKHMADTYRDEGILDSTRYYLDQIERLLPEIDKKDFTGLVSSSQAAYWSKAGNNKKAIIYFEKAFNIWKEIGSKSDQMYVASHLQKHYRAEQDFRNAYKYLNEYVNLKDSLFSQENVEKVKELQLSYEFQKQQIADSLKNEERLNLLKVSYEYEASIEKRSRIILIISMLAVAIIAVLIFTNYKKQKRLAGLLQIRTNEVTDELKQKELLLTEIHHRVKNNFQILSSLLELQAKGTTDPNTKSLISEGKSRVKSMALIHNQLYNTDSLKVSVLSYLQNLFAEIQRSFENISSDAKFAIDSDIEIDVDTMVPLGLIANELITNSFKYASANGLQLTISLSRMEDSLLLTVKDNGPGIPDGFDIQRAKSTGLWLVSRLALQIHGRYEYAYDAGAVFKIYFNQSQYINS